MFKVIIFFIYIMVLSPLNSMGLKRFFSKKQEIGISCFDLDSFNEVIKQFKIKKINFINKSGLQGKLLLNYLKIKKIDSFRTKMPYSDRLYFLRQSGNGLINFDIQSDSDSILDYISYDINEFKPGQYVLNFIFENINKSGSFFDCILNISFNPFIDFNLIDFHSVFVVGAPDLFCLATNFLSEFCFDGITHTNFILKIEELVGIQDLSDDNYFYYKAFNKDCVSDECIVRIEKQYMGNYEISKSPLISLGELNFILKK